MAGNKTMGAITRREISLRSFADAFAAVGTGREVAVGPAIFKRSGRVDARAPRGVSR